MVYPSSPTIAKKVEHLMLLTLLTLGRGPLGLGKAMKKGTLIPESVIVVSRSISKISTET